MGSIFTAVGSISPALSSGYPNLVLCCFCTTTTPDDLSPRVSYPRDLILRSFSARKYRFFLFSHSPKAYLSPPTATQEISFIEQPFDINFPPIAACCYQYYFSMFSSCIQYFVALSLLILRIRFQTILRIFLLKYPIYQVISIFIYYLFLFFNKASFYLTIN